MWKLCSFLLLFCLSFNDVDASCMCYQSANYTGKNAPISNSFDTANFSPCVKDCFYTAYSGDDTFGWTGFTVLWSSANSGGVLEIYDGAGISGTPIIQVKEGENVTSADIKSTIQSSKPYITINFRSGSAPSTYFGNIKAQQGLFTTSPPTSTTPVPTTVTYNSAIFSRNPALISHDILFVVNQKSTGGLVSLVKMNAIISNFVSKLSTTFDINSSTRSRLSLATLTPYDPFYSVQGDFWNLDASTLISSLPKSGINIEGNIDTALIGLADLFFTVNQNMSSDTRNNAQRSIVLLSAEWPSSATLGDSVRQKFDERGVNLLVIGYSLTSSENSQLLNPNRWYNALNTLDTDDKFVASFVNPFYFNDKSNTNYWCPSQQFPATVAETGVITATFFEPINYSGPNGNETFPDWSQVPPFDGQTARYCNFGNKQYVYNKTPDVATLKVTVFYELEAGKDVLNFYDADNNLIASFTGYDIAASSFYTSTSKLTARYTSDNNSVYRGFFVKITTIPSQ